MLTIFSRFRTVTVLFVICCGLHSAAQLKSIVYDFDGLDIGASNIPEGDYFSGDLAASVSSNPLGMNDMLGDRCMKLDMNWNTGTGAFGRGVARYIEFFPNGDILNFYFYNPASNNQNASFEVVIGDDDDGNMVFDTNADDTWKKSFNIPAGGGWQLYTIPLSSMADGNAGGNGEMDMTFTGNKGCLLFVEFNFSKSGNAGNASFYLDMIAFSEGALPRGASEFDLPPGNPGDYCHLGAFTHEAPGQYHLTASKFETLFPAEPNKRIRFVNTFIHWAYGTSTTPSEMPGQAAQTLLNNGYTPVLTWEPLFAGFERLDSRQPRLNNILSGEYDYYIDAFADELKKLSDTVIIRLMHEFEGDWYPWSICKNDNDPNRYIAAYRHIVDRCRARGAGKVKWMWCVNSDYAPYEYYNWIVKAYPGDEYVNIVATDIYNNHFPVDLPWWRSFRWQTAESYYYLTKYFGHKPLYICEVGCRERKNGESPGSETKGAWFAKMDKELQSNFRQVRALIFFHANPDEIWMVNSSPAALQSLTDNVWYDDYYFRSPGPVPVGAQGEEEVTDLYVYPNPATVMAAIGLVSDQAKGGYYLRVINSMGQTIISQEYNRVSSSFSDRVWVDKLPRGVYYFELTAYPKEGSGQKEFKQCKKVLLL